MIVGIQYNSITISILRFNHIVFTHELSTNSFYISYTSSPFYIYTHIYNLKELIKQVFINLKYILSI